MIGRFRFLRPRYLGLLLASSLAVNLLALALPLMTMQIYDRVLPNRASDTLLVLTIGVSLAALAEFVLRICRSVATGLSGAGFEHDAATLALRHVLETDPKALGRAGIGSAAPAILAQHIGAAARLKDYYGGQMMVTLLLDLPFIFLFLGLEVWLAGWLAAVPCAVLALFLLAAWYHGRQLRDLMNAREAQDDARYNFITHALRVVHTVKALCLEMVTVRRFEAVQRDSGKLNYRIAALNGQTGSVSYGFAQILTVAMLATGAPLAIDSHISVGTLIACVLLSGQVMQPLQRGLQMWMRFQDIGLARQRLGALLELPRRRFLPPEQLQANHGGLLAENLRFGYSADAAVIDGASLTLQPGETVAITGGFGTGRTTLLELLAGVYLPERGRVTLSGMDVVALPVNERARYLAYLPIHGAILRGSIMDNLTGFNPQARAAARTVADRLGIEAAVALLPAGYDTPLEGHATDVVSPGLKQRISIARALLHKPRLILFDNADQGMDQESYIRIFDMLARLKGKAMMVLVSEDRNILSLADRIYHFQRGQLTAVVQASPLVTDRQQAFGASPGAARHAPAPALLGGAVS